MAAPHDGTPRRVRLVHDRLGTLIDPDRQGAATVAVAAGRVGELLGEWTTGDGFRCHDIWRLRVDTDSGPADIPVLADEIEEVTS